jgi:hypothetical protein
LSNSYALINITVTEVSHEEGFFRTGKMNEESQPAILCGLSLNQGGNNTIDNTTSCHLMLLGILTFAVAPVSIRVRDTYSVKCGMERVARDMF